MSKKHIEIEILDKVTETVTTPGTGTITYDNAIQNRNFDVAFNTSNQGLAGCSFVGNDFITAQWMGGASGTGTPIASTWKPCAYDKDEYPGPGICGTQYRDTPLPVQVGGVNHAQFAGTGTSPYTGYVMEGDFNNTNNSDPWPGYLAQYDVQALYPVTTWFANGNYPSVPVATQGWIGINSQCGDVGLGAYNPVGLQGPQLINQSGAFLKMHPAQDDNCGAGGQIGTQAIIQWIQGLTAGNDYTLSIKLKEADTSGNGCFRMGNTYLAGGTVLADGETYYNLGGDSATMYGNAAGNDYGCSNGGGGMYFRPNTTSVQSFSFTSVGGRELFILEYFTFSPQFGYGADDIEFDIIQIQDLGAAKPNASAIYTLADPSINGDPPYTGIIPNYLSSTLKINISQAPNDTTFILNKHSGTYVQGDSDIMPLLENTITLDNNGGGIPWTTGMNNIDVTDQIQPGNSSAPYNPEERFLDIVVINPSGGTVRITYVDIESEVQTASTTTTTIDEERSVLGKLQVSDSEDFPFNISYNISDGKDLDSRFGDYSHSFDIPATKNNNQILNSVWNANSDQEKKQLFGVKDCRVLVDGIPFFEGSMQVKKSSHRGKPESYSCTLYGGNFSWMSLLKDKELCAIFKEDGTDNFLYDYSNIENAWQTSNTTTDIQYPLVSYADFNQGGLPNYVNCFESVMRPDWQPAFYVKNMLERIFTNIGYKIDSSFFQTDHFNRLLCDFPFLKNNALDDSQFFSCEQNMQIEYYQTVDPKFTDLDSLSDWSNVILNTNVTDPSNGYNNTTGVFTAQRAGFYDVYAQNAFQIWLTSDNYDTCNFGGCECCDWQYDGPASYCDEWRWSSRIRITDNSGTPSYSYLNTTANGWGITQAQPLDWFLVSCWDVSINSCVLPSGTVYLNIGDTIELQGKFFGFNHCGCTPNVWTTFGYSSAGVNYGAIQPMMRITYQGNTISIGDTLNPNEILPCSVSQTEFIKSIAHLFNLYFTTDVTNKTVYIEPFNEFFYEKAQGLDWTQKVDYTQPIEDDYDIGLKRELEIGYKLDGGDVFAREKNYKEGVTGDGTKLFNYKEELGEDFETGKIEMVNPLFASTTQVWDNDAYDYDPAHPYPPLIPNLWNMDCWSGLSLQNTQARPSSLIENFVPRIYYYCFENPVGPTTIPDGQIVNPSPDGIPTHWSRINSGGVQVQNAVEYPRATFVDWEELDHTITMRPSLSFNDETFNAPWLTGVSPTNFVPGLYTTYYKNMIEQLKASPRIRIIYVDLKMADILNLDMRRLVYLDESWWRINRISEYSPAKNQSTKVELIQWIDVGYWPVVISKSQNNHTTIKYT